MKTLKEILFSIIMKVFALGYIFVNKSGKKIKIAFLVEEFFHKDLGGFGGYGITVKNLTDYFNTQTNCIKTDVLLTRMASGRQVMVKHYHNADVVFRSGEEKNYLINFFKYCLLVNKRNIGLLISIDWYRSYEQVALSLPKTPLVIWIKDPRGLIEWKKIFKVPLEVMVIGDDYKSGNIDRIVERKLASVQKILALSFKFERKVIFATQARFLLERAQRVYGIERLEAFFLPNPISLPNIKNPNFSDKPTVCFLGRLEPIKRPWIFFELAKLFPNIDFLVAGIPHYPEVMNPIIDKYTSVSNLKFLGMVSGKEKHYLLNNCWALINTSVHEALPVTFLEAFSYYKPIISCQNPDNLTSTFGWYTGEIPGEGRDEASLTYFSEAIAKCVSNKELRLNFGIKARKYVEDNHTFKNYYSILKQEAVAKSYRNGKS